MHLSDGDLRRRVDEPDALPAEARRHADACLRCRARAAQIAADAEWAGRLFAAAGEDSMPAASEALARLRHQGAHAGGRRGDAAPAPLRVRWPWAAGAAAAVAAGALVVYGPVGSYASQLLTVFEPTQVAAVTVPKGAFSALGDLRAYGDLTLPQGDIQSVASQSAAESLSGLQLTLPTALPGGLGQPTFGAFAGSTAQFTFLSSKAEQSATAAGVTLPPMPPTLDHSTLSVSIGPLALAAYPAPGAPAGAGGQGPAGYEDLYVAVMQAPVVRSNGADAATIESYLLSMPGIPASLASELRALEAPSQTLPLPIPSGVATSSNIVLGGRSAVAIADQSGIYHAVVWEAAGRIHAVAGPFTAAQVQAAAQSIEAQGD